jgi:hypothetical protein
MNIKILIFTFFIVVGLAAFMPLDMSLDILIGPSNCDFISDCYDLRKNSGLFLIQSWLKILFISSLIAIIYIRIKSKN